MESGLSDRAGRIAVKYYPDSDRLTSMFDYPHAERSLILQEQVERGDKFLAAEGLDHVDLLKVDAEGADLAVLRGFEGALRSAAVSTVQFEYGFACILAGVFLLNFYELFSDYGYEVGRVHRTHVEFQPYRLESENFFGPNFVAVHRSRSELIRRLERKSRCRDDEPWTE